jgi:hypothetical protein
MEEFFSWSRSRVDLLLRNFSSRLLQDLSAFDTFLDSVNVRRDHERLFRISLTLPEENVQERFIRACRLASEAFELPEADVVEPPPDVRNESVEAEERTQSSNEIKEAERKSRSTDARKAKKAVVGVKKKAEQRRLEVLQKRERRERQQKALQEEIVGLKGDLEQKEKLVQQQREEIDMLERKVEEMERERYVLQTQLTEAQELAGPFRDRVRGGVQVLQSLATSWNSGLIGAVWKIELAEKADVDAFVKEMQQMENIISALNRENSKLAAEIRTQQQEMKGTTHHMTLHKKVPSFDDVAERHLVTIGTEFGIAESRREAGGR